MVWKCYYCWLLDGICDEVFVYVVVVFGVDVEVVEDIEKLLLVDFMNVWVYQYLVGVCLDMFVIGGIVGL